MKNDIVKFKCPHCQQLLAFKRPEDGNSVSMVCPGCGEPIRIMICEKAIRMAGQPKPAPQKMARLVATGSNVAYPLHKGSNIIGRKDEDTIQDIALANDMTISRRSVDLNVGLLADGGYSYMLRVLNAKNPVYVNSTPMHNGNSIMLRPGDTIKLGGTKLMLAI